MKGITQFTHLYSLSKTLRFELRPMGNTLAHIIQSGILEQDTHRAESYKKVKKIIDRYHKEFMEKALKNFEFQMNDNGKKDSLSEYFFLYSLGKRSDKQEEEFEKVKDNLRKQIVKSFKASPQFKCLFKKELIEKDLCNQMTCTEEEKKLIDEFHNFTSYFTGFYENRENMYSDKAETTAVAFRIIHQNLPKFIDNISIFDKVNNIDEIRKDIEQLQKDFETNGLLNNGEKIEDIFSLNNYGRLTVQSRIDIYNAIIGGRTTEKGEKIQGINEYINLYNQNNKDSRLPKMKALYKQILSDRQPVSWIEEGFIGDNNVLGSIEEFYASSQDLTSNNSVLKQILSSLNDFDLSNIYLTNDKQLTNISHHLYGSWAVIKNAILADMQNEINKKRKESDDSYTERLQEAYAKKESFSIGYINKCLQKEFDENLIPVENYFMQLGEKVKQKRNPMCSPK